MKPLPPLKLLEALALHYTANKALIQMRGAEKCSFPAGKAVVHIWCVKRLPSALFPMNTAFSLVHVLFTLFVKGVCATVNWLLLRVLFQCFLDLKNGS